MLVLFDFSDDYVPVGMLDSIPTFESTLHVDSILVGPAKERFKLPIQLRLRR